MTRYDRCTCCGALYVVPDPPDLDFATDARPEETKKVLTDAGLPVYPTGEKFGMIATRVESDRLVQERTTCSPCWKRGGLCLHNIEDHPNRFHSSRPHPDTDEFADDPEHCPTCLEAKDSAAWGRRVMKLNPVGTWPVGGSTPEKEV